MKEEIIIITEHKMSICGHKTSVLGTSAKKSAEKTQDEQGTF